MKVVLTYGTFDLFHVGHLNLLERLKGMGDKLVVGVSTDEFNAVKGKKTVISYEDRVRIVSSLKFVDVVIPEHTWEQKKADIEKYNVSIFAMGSDWKGKFDSLKEYCQVEYLSRTEGVSSSDIKEKLKMFDKAHIEELRHALELISSIVERFD